MEQNITVWNTLNITCSIRCLKVVSDCVWNQACSYSKRQIVFDFLGLTNQRPWFGICLHCRQLYTFNHVSIVNKQSNTLVNGFFFMLMICKCNAAAIIRDLTTVFINTILCVQFVYTKYIKLKVI